MHERLPTAMHLSVHLEMASACTLMQAIRVN